MTTCKRCNSGRLKRIDIYKFHQVYECVNCFALTSSKIKDCICDRPNHIVVIEHYGVQKTRIFYQCSHCGYADRSKQLANDTYSVKIRGEFNSQLFEERSAIIADEQKEISERFAIFKKTKYYKYQAYLLSDTWKNLRQQVFARDNGICLYCKTSAAEQVHHIHYLTLYKETLNDLESVCASCHHDIHKNVFASV